MKPSPKRHLHSRFAILFLCALSATPGWARAYDALDDSDPADNVVIEGASSGGAVGIQLAWDTLYPPVRFELDDDAGGRFQADPDSGVVTVADGSLVNFETDASHTITARATDDSGDSRTAQFTIIVQNVAPNTPSDTDAWPDSVAEDATTGATVGITLSADDPNGGVLTYELTDNAGGRFQVDPSSGEVTVADATLLDFEAATSHTITARVSDGTEHGLTADFTIAVGNVVPTAPNDIDAGPDSVTEGAGNGTYVGITLLAGDPGNSAVYYELVDSADGRFQVDTTTGEVTVADASKLDADQLVYHTITARATDGTDYGPTMDFRIDLWNVAPSDPTDTDPADNTVAEGAADGTYVGITLSADDPNTDPHDGTLTYLLTDDAGGRFQVDSITGEIKVANGALLDHEASAFHTILAQVFDGTDYGLIVDFTIAVENAAPSTPVDADPTDKSVGEGAPNGTPVAITLESSDPGGGSVTYELTDNADGRFQVDPTSGVVTVADGWMLDFELGTSHTITARASDGLGTGGLTAQFTIMVSNITPTPPTDDDSTANAIAEKAPSGTPVGIWLHSVGPGDPTLSYALIGLVSFVGVTYELTDDAGGRFQVDMYSGEVTVADGSQLDHELSASHTVKARANDGPEPGPESEFTIEVTNVNEAPVFTKGADQRHPAGTYGSQFLTGWATGIDDGDGTVAQDLSFSVTEVGSSGLFDAPPVLFEDGTLSYFLNGTSGTATLNVELTDDDSINGYPALTTAPQSFTITVDPVPDYTVTTAGNMIVVTDTAGNGDALTVTEPGAGLIRFTAAGRTFSLDGSVNFPDTTFDLDLASVTSITINAAGGDDTVDVGTFTGTLPSLAIDGGAGADTVSLLSGDTVTVGDADGVVLGGSAVTTLLTIQVDGPATQAGAITGAGGIRKQGIGTLSLSQENTYTGDTTVETGTLALVHASHNNVAGSPNVVVQADAFLDVTGLADGRFDLAGGQALKGGGTLIGALGVASGATVSPGASPGILNSGSVAFASGSTFEVEIEGTTVGAQYDQLNVTGAVALGDATLVVSGAHLLAGGDTFVIINNDDNDAVSGGFAGLAEGATVPFNGVNLKISYLGGDGNDVTLAAPPPTAARLAHFRATRIEAGEVRLDWSTLVEVQTLGFLVERARSDGGWERVTNRLIPALGTDLHPQSYAFTDPVGTAGAPGSNYRLLEVDLRGRAKVLAEAIVAPATEVLVQRTSAGMNLQIRGQPNGTVVIESADSVTGPWSAMAQAPLDEDGAASLDLAPNGVEAIRFYRVLVE